MFGFDDAIMLAFADEAAMAYASEAAAASAAEAAAATAAADAAATTAATNLATDAAMMDLAGSLATTGSGLGGVAGSGINQANLAANVLSGSGGAGSAGINEALVGASQNAAMGVPNSGIMAAAPPAPAMSPAQLEYLQASQASVEPGITRGLTPLSQTSPSTANIYEGLNAPVASRAPSVASPTYNMFTGTGADISSASNPLLTESFANPGTSIGQGIGPAVHDPQIASGAPAWQEWAAKGGIKSEPSALERGMSAFESYVKQNPISSAMSAVNLASMAGKMGGSNDGMPKSKYSGVLSKYRISDDFKASEATPNVYRPEYKAYAQGGVMTVGDPSSQMAEPRNTLNPMDTVSTMTGGGIASFKRGGGTNAALDYYRQMTESRSDLPSHARGPAGPVSHDPGIYYDMDPDTRFQDPLTAAQIRQAKVNKRANMQLPPMKRPTPLGTINLRPPGSKSEQGQSYLDPETAAQGGIMQARSSLGGYAAGGNPRLLKGPGDGMSDNIPATISGKQPARLADGEFVVPADVVSHLGNGSTDAGAKKLHQMMDNVRKARTGRKAQGKQINPNKFMPK